MLIRHRTPWERHRSFHPCLRPLWRLRWRSARSGRASPEPSLEVAKRSRSHTASARGSRPVHPSATAAAGPSARAPAHFLAPGQHSPRSRAPSCRTLRAPEHDPAPHRLAVAVRSRTACAAVVPVSQTQPCEPAWSFLNLQHLGRFATAQSHCHLAPCPSCPFPHHRLPLRHQPNPPPLPWHAADRRRRGSWHAGGSDWRGKGRAGWC
mmetsp:Transcript_18902/g.42252  ORF Transcript_18902/g.42252 Transcript_18902/m.42252 type:complete len:208 (-) Transcript_18902:52-675(-)